MDEILELMDKISIHTFLAEGDDATFSLRKLVSVISIHTFLAEGDAASAAAAVNSALFQSTPSSRKVTAKISIIIFL